jgi:hypothetical protein
MQSNIIKIIVIYTKYLTFCRSFTHSSKCAICISFAIFIWTNKIVAILLWQIEEPSCLCIHLFLFHAFKFILQQWTICIIFSNFLSYKCDIFLRKIKWGWQNIRFVFQILTPKHLSPCWVQSYFKTTPLESKLDCAKSKPSLVLPTVRSCS